ncbi:MAG: hypothetical protein JW384_02668 [Nitrosomonadaceae bacterium]|nr:hypothetical protein [Nitrosomonadaceae bacterium]
MYAPFHVVFVLIYRLTLSGRGVKLHRVNESAPVGHRAPLPEAEGAKDPLIHTELYPYLLCNGFYPY